MNGEEVTPEGSVAPVFIDPSPTPVVVTDVPVFVNEGAADLVASGVAKLVALGLTEEEALALASR